MRPSGATATSAGDDVAKVTDSVPLGWKTWMRPLPVSVSATTMRPSGATATSAGDDVAKVTDSVPLGWKTWMRPLAYPP